MRVGIHVIHAPLLLVLCRYGVAMCGDGANDCGVSAVDRLAFLVLGIETTVD